MVDQPVDGGGSGHGILENADPVAENQITGDEDAFAFVPLGQEGEEHLHFIATLLDVADVVEDHGMIDVERGEFAPIVGAGEPAVKPHPGEAATKDLYHLPPEEDAKVPTVCHSLDQALDYLDKDRAFLTKGGVFTDSYLDAYIELKMQEVTRFRMTTHPVEFDMYYSL